MEIVSRNLPTYKFRQKKAPESRLPAVGERLASSGGDEQSGFEETTQYTKMTSGFATEGVNTGADSRMGSSKNGASLRELVAMCGPSG